MKYFLYISLAALCLFLAGPSRADDARGLHDFSHAAGGFGVGTIGYGIWKAIVTSKDPEGAPIRPEDRVAAIIFGALTGVLACATKEMSDVERGSNSWRDFGYCGVGTGAAALTVITFGF